MAEVTVTLSDEMVEFLRGIYETQQKLALAAEHINAASEALSNLGCSLRKLGRLAYLRKTLFMVPQFGLRILM